MLLRSGRLLEPRAGPATDMRPKSPAPLARGDSVHGGGTFPAGRRLWGDVHAEASVMCAISSSSSAVRSHDPFNVAEVRGQLRLQLRTQEPHQRLHVRISALLDIRFGTVATEFGTVVIGQMAG